MKSGAEEEEETWRDRETSASQQKKALGKRLSSHPVRVDGTKIAPAASEHGTEIATVVSEHGTCSSQ